MGVGGKKVRPISKSTGPRKLILWALKTTSLWGAVV
jgi:hypothetical protein